MLAPLLCLCGGLRPIGTFPGHSFNGCVVVSERCIGDAAFQASRRGDE